jgi:hypothetical protein
MVFALSSSLNHTQIKCRCLLSEKVNYITPTYLGPISFEHMSFWCLIFDLHVNTLKYRYLFKMNSYNKAHYFMFGV